VLDELKKDLLMPTLEKQFAGKPLGSRRAELISAYADLMVAAHEASKQTMLMGERIVGEHMVIVASYTRQSALAKFEATLEQVRFDAEQAKRMADQQVRLAEAGVIDAVKRLQILGVAEDMVASLAGKGAGAAGVDPDEDVTAYPIVAPFDATVLTTSVVYSQRAELTDVLMTLADVSSVYVVANIPEADFAVLPRLQEATVRVTAAAYPGRTFEAKVLYTGATVDPTTRRVRLVAEAANPDGLLKLGLFVQILLDSPRTRPVLTVPAGAVVEVEGRKTVFVPGKDDRTFQLRAVTTGREAEGRVAITHGLAPGERVVTSGAFLLKSELILQSEPEED
jgi:RND family efflux transporter MFP subunit